MNPQHFGVGVGDNEKNSTTTTTTNNNNSTVILIERKLIKEINDRQHVAGGDHTGIIINKDALNEKRSEKIPPHLNLEFRVFLVSANSGQHTQESRALRFWFRPWLTNSDKQEQISQEFFRELISPKEFPRDYVGFIKKVMKLLQKGFNDVEALEVELKTLEQSVDGSAKPPLPRDGYYIFCYGDSNRKYEEALLASRTVNELGENALMKKFWLEIYNQNYKYK